MTLSRMQRIEELFGECLELPDAARRAHLDIRCAGDDELRALVLDLLERDARSSERTPGALRFTSEVTPSIVGPYRLLRKLGEGGFGEVYEADQTSPIRRRVALKILKAGMDSKAILARFEVERQALALMDHHGIARVLDAGETDAGRSYFVMELVDGPSITDYADAQHLSLFERLRLFVSVCRAVEHAHQKGIIHRDLKPSNILIALGSGKPLPKVIDFGIAKATSGALLEESLHTRADQFLGTPEYASPEQTESGGADVDTRTDVYSLGVVLYRLLTGRLPIERAGLRSAGITEVRRALREDEPSRPSAAASGAATSAAHARDLRGDLDWITLRALEKDRALRYPSAAAFADDIERHLQNHPVLAGPPTTWYRIRKFVRRRRGLVLAATAVLLALVAGIVATSLQAVRAVRAEREAVRQATVADEVNRFLTRMLGSANPESNPGGSKILLRDAIDLAARELEGTPMEDHAVEAGIRHTLGTTYSGLGLYEQSTTQLARAAALRQEAFGRDDPRTLESMLSRIEAEERFGRTDIADSLLLEVGRRIERNEEVAIGDQEMRFLQLRAERLANAGALDDADSLLGVVVESRRAAAGRAPGDRIAFSRALVDLAEVRGNRGRFAEADSIGREGLEITRAAYPGEHHEVAMAAARLSGILENLGKLDDAEVLRREALTIHEHVLGADHPMTAISLANLGLLLDRKGRASEAEARYREALGILIPSLGKEHREVLAVLDNLATVVQARGGYDEALRLRLDVLAGRRRTLGQTHADVASALNNLGSLHRLRGEYDLAVPVFREAIDLFARALGPAHPNVAVSKHNLGKTLLDDGRPADAEPWTREALELAERLFPPGHVNIAIFQATRGRALTALRRYDEAERILRTAYDGLRAVLGEPHPRCHEVAAELASLYTRTGRDDEARRWRADARSDANSPRR